MQVLLDVGADLIAKRAWYENRDFFTPRHYHRFLRPIVEADAAQAYAHAAKLAYIITANCMPLFDDIRAAGVDAVLGVDLLAWNLEQAVARLGGKLCWWGGINGHFTVEQGTPEQVRTEVQTALRVLASAGGFILLPVDTVRGRTALARENGRALIAERQAPPPD